MLKYFRNFVIFSPWKGWGPLFEHIWIPFIQGSFGSSLVEIGAVVLEKMIFLIRLCNFTILQLSPLRKGNGPSFEQTWIPFTPGSFVLRLVKIDPVVLERKSKIGKVYRRTDRQAIRKAHFSFQFRWTLCLNNCSMKYLIIFLSWKSVDLPPAPSEVRQMLLWWRHIDKCIAIK